MITWWLCKRKQRVDCEFGVNKTGTTFQEKFKCTLVFKDCNRLRFSWQITNHQLIVNQYLLFNLSNNAFSVLWVMTKWIIEAANIDSIKVASLITLIDWSKGNDWKTRIEMRLNVNGVGSVYWLFTCESLAFGFFILFRRKELFVLLFFCCFRETPKINAKLH